jgi:hypothetical protein
MKKELLIVGIAVLLICIGLSGCNENKSKNELDKFLGTWASVADENYTITFYSNGTFVRGEYVSGTYNITDGRVVLDTVDNTPGVHPDNREFIATFDYVFSDSGKTLTLTVPGMSLGTTFAKQ